MARMVATKAALSIRVDALTDVDDKSEPMAPSIGIENRAKLEARLRALEQGGDANGVRAANGGRQQNRFQMKGEASTYNAAADAVDLMPSQREPVETAVKAALDVKAEKKRAKEERRAKKKAEKAKESESEDENAMDVDEDEGEKKRKRKEAADGKKSKVCRLSSVRFLRVTNPISQHGGETEEERKARKKAKKAEKEAAANGDGESSKKKRRKSEA